MKARKLQAVDHPHLATVDSRKTAAGTLRLRFLRQRGREWRLQDPFRGGRVAEVCIHTEHPEPRLLPTASPPFPCRFLSATSSNLFLPSLPSSYEPATLV